MNNPLKSLLIVKNPDDAQLIQQYLKENKKYNFEITQARSLKEAKLILEKEKFDLIVLDFTLPDNSDLQTFRAINSICPDLPIIIISDLQNENLALTAVKEGAQDYLLKTSLNGELLEKIIVYSIERKQNEKTLKELAVITDNSSDAIVGLSLEGDITSWNKAAEHIYGYSATETLGKKIYDFSTILIPPDRLQETKQMLDMIRQGKKIIEYETIRYNKNGKMLYICISSSPIVNSSNKVIGASVLIRDITDKKIHEQQLAIQHRINLILAESSNLSDAAHSILKSICEIMQWQVGEIWGIDISTDALHYISSWYSNYSYAELERISKDILFKFGEGLPGHIWKIQAPYITSNLKAANPTRAAFLKEQQLNNCFGFPIIFQHEVLGVILFLSKHLQQLDVNTIALFSTIGNQIGTFIKSKSAEKELFHLTQHDSLTGLPNRIMFENSITQAISQAKSNHTLLALLYVDIDNFKKINDSIGYEKGDSLLQEIASKISENLRPNDVVARLVGDEFGILLPEVNSTKDMATLAQTLLDVISRPFLIDDNKFYITASIGISIYPDNGEDAITLLKNADIAMSYAKLQGPNRYQFCLANMATLMQQKIALENELHEALNKNEFVMHYQPQVNIQTGQVAGFEALIRWNRSGEKLVAPDQFIPLAEDANLIIPIGNWTMKNVFYQMKQWQKQGLTKLIKVAININAQQFTDNLLPFLSRLLNETQLDPYYFELELTERILMTVSEKKFSILQDIKKLGIQLAIDDFGTGYSSFAYLKNFKVDIIKIDRSFISGLPNDINSKAIVSAIIAMSHALSIKVIAEGVETPEQLDILKKMGCDFYQGFLFSKPLTAEEAYQLLRIQSDSLI